MKNGMVQKISMRFAILPLTNKNGLTMRAALFAALLSFSLPGFTWDGPVIDMHLHAWPSGEDGGPEQPRNQEKMEETLQSLSENNIVLAVASGPQDFLDAWHATGSENIILGPIFPCIEGKNPTWFQHECFDSGRRLSRHRLA